ncbi:aldehyde dehydrogenase family protein [Pseudonocardia thermophila]|jgi:NAD-dependent aldehyde dehydrogenases|uniref:aldehyde dehydrogenase family protein n=1 Tax=Pseudonocardia thermophila TaxID=1848 RepID=UPI00248E69E4|nr:aldehyde dehydrogenase family protein [Pseudonocardia thermophila]
MTISVLARRDELKVGHTGLYIDGRWRDASDGRVWTHVHPATNEEISTFAIGSAADVDEAVTAARRAFDEGPWPRMRARDRIRAVQGIAELIREHREELAALQTLGNAMPITMSRSYGVSGDIAADLFDHFAGWIDKLTGRTYPTYTGQDMQFLSFREPVGVVAAIIPWNAPLLQFANKVAPALAAGCTVVIKPSEYAALAPLRLAQLIDDAGLPPGVFNCVPGPGDPTGEALISHPGVDKISFTGSRAVGKHIQAVAAQTLKRVTLELGGKSAALVFERADVAKAAHAVASRVAMGLSGQVCSSQTRAVVQRSVYDEFLQAVLDAVADVRFGDPFDPATTSAPMINPVQRDKVLRYIRTAEEEGARRLVGGEAPDGELACGNWVTPAVFAEVDNRMTLAQEEVFGPVLAVIPVDDEDEAIRVANDSSYGLSAGVYTDDVAQALRVSRALRTGTVGVNAYAFLPNAPFGGYKESGLGREGGIEGIESMLETKTVMIDLAR